jgi:hypothetical protein
MVAPDSSRHGGRPILRAAVQYNGLYALSGYGLAAVTLALVAVLLELLGAGALMALMIPILPFELIAGLWLLVKGVPEAR